MGTVFLKYPDGSDCLFAAFLFVDIGVWDLLCGYLRLYRLFLGQQYCEAFIFGGSNVVAVRHMDKQRSHSVFIIAAK